MVVDVMPLFSKFAACTTQSAGFTSPGGNTGNLVALTSPRAGLAHASATAIFNPTGDDASLHIYKNGVKVIGGSNAAGSWNGMVGVHGTFTVAASDSITIRAEGESGATLHSGSFILTVGKTAS
jgi:hypothetical protein